MRTLISTRRTVPRARQPDYVRAWDRLQAEATARGANAWRFASAERADAFIEFIEFKGDADPRRHDAVAAALAELARCGDGVVESWVDEPPSNR